MKNAHDIIHSTIITLDIPAFKSSSEDTTHQAPSIEDSLNAVLAGLTHSLMHSSVEEKERIQRRIDETVAMLDRRHW